MNFSRLLTDDEAVAPVIAVVLLVAITVVLAGLIVSFVMGLGSQTQQNTPKATFSFDYSAVDEADPTTSNPQGIVTISHEGGDSIDYRRLYLRGSGFNGTGVEDPVDGGTELEQWVRDEAGVQVHATRSGQWNETRARGDESGMVVASDSVNVYVAQDYDITLTYEAEKSETSSTLASDEGPDA